MSTFSGLSGALSSLYAQRLGLDVVGQNIANANTEGYSRQRLNLEAIGGSRIPAMHSVGDGSAGGVTVKGVDRVQDTFLESRGRAEHALNAYLNDRNRVYSRIEGAFGEPSDTGLQSQLSDMWGAWNDLANRPGDLAARTQLLERAKTVAGTLRGMDATLSSLFDSTREQYDALVTEVNTAAQQVARLNQSVVQAMQAGQAINELADERDLMVLRLSEMTGATVSTQDNGSINVMLSGSALVNGANVRTVETDGAQRLADVAIDPVTLRWTDSGAAVSVPSGEIASTLETLTTTLGDYAGKLDLVAENLATAVNTQHALGYDVTGTAGVDFFSGTTATAIAVAITDPDLIAAASTAGSGGAGSLDSQNATEIANLAQSLTGPDRQYRQLVVDLGVSAQTIQRRVGIQSAITAQIDSARTAQSGVNLDEEMTGLIAYQRAYEAAAKVINTIDDTLASLLTIGGR